MERLEKVKKLEEFERMEKLKKVETTLQYGYFRYSTLLTLL